MSSKPTAEEKLHTGHLRCNITQEFWIQPLNKDKEDNSSINVTVDTCIAFLPIVSFRLYKYSILDKGS